MTSSIVPHLYDLYIVCDKKGCDAAATVRIKASTNRERERAQAEAEAYLASEGWTHWVSIRPARRDYCPAHKPDRRSNMQQVSKERA